ncbi:hypothetical protein [Streptomyces yunnanensis]|nr:hypothetical protein [Streptomyces yunnanensis]
MTDPLQSVVQLTPVSCTTDVINGSGVMVYTVGARAICVELEN